MQRNHHTPAQARRRTGGFTLLELLIAITIIGILAGLLFPAIRGAQQNARIAECRQDINALSGALEQFRSTYGEYPPSRITLYATNSSTNGWMATGNTEVQRSRSIIRKFWPQFNFNYSGAYPWNSTIELRGAECLVFFLGGLARNGGEWNDLVGFSKNPATPFDRTATTRTTPFHTFNPGRLRNAFVDGTNDYRFQTYVDTLPGQETPYLYASSYDGSGFYATDVLGTSSMMQPNRLTADVYRQANNGSYYNKTSFQLISPGFDRQFGVGGVWNAETADTDLVGTRSTERDNITNFSNSVLAPN